MDVHKRVSVREQVEDMTTADELKKMMTVGEAYFVHNGGVLKLGEKAQRHCACGDKDVRRRKEENYEESGY